MYVKIVLMRFNILKFFQDIGNFFKAGTVLGIDIGTGSIKIAEVAGKKGRLQLKNYAILETKDYLHHPNLALQTSSLNIVEDEAVRLLKILIGEMKPKTRVSVAALPSFASFVTLFDIPLLSKKETTQAVNYQARQYIPIPIEDVQIDWMKIDEYVNQRGQKFQRLMLIGAPKKIIESYERIFKQAGIRLVALELDVIALVRAFSDFDIPTLVIDIGALSTNIAVTEAGVVKHSGQTDYSGVHITRAVSQSLDLSMQRAEELKKKRGLLGDGGETELSELILPFLDVIIQEVVYVKSLYERRYGKKIGQFVLTGGGANLLGIENYFSKQLNLQSVPSTVFVDIDYPPQIEPVSARLKNELATALGLGRKYFLS